MRLQIAVENAFLAEPQLDELYVNADGSCFEKKDDALVHSGLIDDNTVCLVGKDDSGKPTLIKVVHPEEIVFSKTPEAPAAQTTSDQTPATDVEESKETPEAPAAETTFDETPATDGEESKETLEAPAVETSSDETPANEQSEAKSTKKNSKK